VADIINITVHGGLNIPRMENQEDVFWEFHLTMEDMPGSMNEILEGGHHIKDHTMSQRWKNRYDQDMPCYRIIEDRAKQLPEVSTQCTKT
jgi:hypothetical protein